VGICPPLDGCVVTPFGALRTHSVGFKPNAVGLFVGYELGGFCGLVEDLFIVVEIDLVADLELFFCASQTLGVVDSCDPNGTFLHGLFDHTLR